MTTTAPRTWKATTAGILNIIAGGLNGLGALGLIIALFAVGSIDIMRFLPPEDASFIMPLVVPILIVALVLNIVATVFPIIGGIFALQRRRWGWALAGSIIAIFRSLPLGVLSTIFVAMARDEFE
ncbi:MAG: hypothetical protein HQ588_00415 [Deltaproteobacteria bacterium]|nr:hypothetical protein [Deltaproteobacteria bacterium]